MAVTRPWAATFLHPGKASVFNSKTVSRLSWVGSTTYGPNRGIVKNFLRELNWNVNESAMTKLR